MIVAIPFFIFYHTYMGALMMQVLGVVAVYELTSAVGMKKKIAAAAPFYLAAVGMPLLIYFERTRDEFFGYSTIAFFVIALYILTFAVFSKGKIKVDGAAILYIMSFYVLVSFNSLYGLRHTEKGVYIYLLPFIASWATDIFAYFSGRLFGRHKLIPDVSPKKTVEGAIGGFVAAIALTLLYGLIIDLCTDVKVHYLLLAAAGALMSAVSMAGDLIASLVKRHCGIKDYGRILPGHGGILDRFDSVLAAAPMLIILYKLPIGFALFV